MSTKKAKVCLQSHLHMTGRQLPTHALPGNTTVTNGTRACVASKSHFCDSDELHVEHAFEYSAYQSYRTQAHAVKDMWH